MTKSKCLALLLSFCVCLMNASCEGLLSGNRTETEAPNGSARPAPHFKPGFNLFSPEQDIQLGRQSAAQVANQVSLLNDEPTVGYIRRLCAKLAAKAGGFPFQYQFNVVATREVNAFALPGGFVFVNAGTILAAKSEGELAGVMAHEVMHVALRHGTNQATKAYLAKAGLGVLGTLAGATRSPDLAQVVQTIGGAGANVVFLKFGRSAERQADLEGARVMAEAGYDPRDMAHFFETLESRGGQRVPEFLSDHPDPGNRVAAVNEILPSLPVVRNPARTSGEFESVKARLSGGTRGASGLTRNEATRPARVGPRDPQAIEPNNRPAAPASQFKEYTSPDGAFAFQYPLNWERVGADNTTLIFAPPSGYGSIEGGMAVTHGIFIGTTAIPAEMNRNLEQATIAFVQNQLNVNPDFQVVRQPQVVRFNNRQAVATVVAGSSTVTGTTEVDVIYTTLTADGKLFYLITIAPENELRIYQPSFERIAGSLRLAN